MAECERCPKGKYPAVKKEWATTLVLGRVVSADLCPQHRREFDRWIETVPEFRKARAAARMVTAISVAAEGGTETSEAVLRSLTEHDSACDALRRRIIEWVDGEAVHATEENASE